MLLHRFSGLALALLGAGCASAVSRPVADVPIVASEPSADVDAIVGRFFAEGPASPTFAADLQTSLGQHAASGGLHEVAGYWALLRGDDHGAWQHFLLAATDVHHAGADLDLYELSRLDLTRSELDTTERALAKIEQASTDVGVRARAAYLRAAYLRLLGRRDEAAREIGELGFVRSVELLGAFDNEEGKGFAETYPPESSVDLGAVLPGAILPVKWRTVDALPFAATISLGDTVHPSQQAVAYAALWVTVPASTEVVLRLSTDTPIAAWVDHALVVREDRVRHFGLDNVTAPVVLHGGANQILVKSGVKTGPWNLGIRLTDAAGRPVPGAAVTLVPARDPGLPTRSTTPAPPTAPARGPRDAFASARWLVARGLCQPGLSALEKLLTASTRNSLLRYFAADAALQDRQTERALDLLTAAISPTEALPGFLRARAQIYVQKELWNQAQGDLTRAVASQPAARLARTDLADVLGRRGWEADRVRVLQDVIASWPDAEAAYLSLGAAREAQGHRTPAEQAYEHAVELEPGASHPLRALRNLAERREDAAAAELSFERLEAINPLDVNDQLARADFERAQGRLAEADARLRALSMQSPDHPTAALRRAQIADELGQRAQAIALYQAAQDRDPRDSWLAERLQHLRPDSEDVLRRYTPTDENIEAAVKRASTRGDAASHVEVLLYDQATLLNADGSSRTMHTEVMRSMSQKGRDEIVRIGLPTDGQVRVLKAFAQTPDGQRQEASSIDKASVRFRNLEVGSTVVLQYAHYARRGGALSDDFYSEGSFSLAGRHIDRMRWVIVAPKGKELHLDVDPRVKHATSEVTAPQGTASIVHELTREDVQALPSEPSMVPFPDVQAHVVVTTLPSWDSFIRWERAILDESFPADPGLDALATRLTQGAATPRDKLGKLFAFVAQEIRYQQEYESILAGWQPHRSSVVLERKYGDCKDKATLLIALARAVGIDLEFAVLATHRLGHPDRKVVFPKFNHAIVYVPVQRGIEEAFFTDPTVDALDLWNLREDDQGSAALVLNPSSGKWTWLDIPFQAPEYKLQRWKAEVDIESPEQVRAHSHLEVRGGHASSLRTALRSEDQSRQVYDYLASQLFPGSKLVSASAPDHESFLHPLRIDQEIDASASIRQEGAHYRLKLPNDADNAPTKLAERQTPLDLGPPTSDESEVVVHLGKGVRLVEMPAPVDVVDPCFHVSRKVSGDKATVTVTEAFQETCTTVSVADYPRYRAAMEHARSMLDTALVFDKVATAKPAR
jgi:tetratricopeptide (TPR) repeat protein